VPDERTLKSLSRSNKVGIIVDNYGPALSKSVQQITDALNTFGIKHIVRKYYGEDAYYNGWIDMSDLSKRHRTEDENKSVYKRCIFSEKFQRFLIVDGKMYICAVCKRCESLNLVNAHIDRIDLFDDLLSKEQKKNK